MSGLKIALVSLGCAKNLVDSEIILAQLKEENFVLVTDLSAAEAIIINTCGFIESAKQESINKILELAELKNGNCRVLLAAGCLAQRYGEELLTAIPELDGIFGINDLQAAAAAVRRALAGERISFLQGEYEAPEDAPRILSTPSHTAYLKIAEGCDNHCTYCAIPAIRGPYRSRSRAAVVAEAKKLVQSGVKELNLIAQDITPYGLDTSGKLELPLLLEELAELPGLAWIRLLYAYPERLDSSIVETMARLDQVCKYLDIPLQHGSDHVLRRMGRKMTAEKMLQLLSELRQVMPEITIRSSFIVGFPGETEADFQELLSFLRAAQLDRIGFFAYSQEEGTPAARLPQQIPTQVKEARLAEAIAVQSEIVTAKQKALIGRKFTALVDGYSAQDSQTLLLRTPLQAPEVDGYVRISHCSASPGTMLPVTITAFDGYDLLGTVDKR
ncbi:MAG: 30S ribosomal protein S12 methylthiotransferase RimO [Dethiobacteraceae bacterium]|jgi:ribosomal protein S12 methylthiotransferase|nr:30S ribosomal protein S12 methylthiotransferase RimO [Bacillota bacterium]